MDEEKDLQPVEEPAEDAIEEQPEEAAEAQIDEAAEEAAEAQTDEAAEEAPAEVTAKKNRKDAILKELVSDLIVVVIAVVAALLLIKFVVQPVQVNGDSMNNNLFDGEKLMMEKVSRYGHKINRYDIVVFNPGIDEDTLYIKRVIGLPGETIQIDEYGDIYIDGVLLEDDIYGREVIEDPGNASEMLLLGEDEYFVMGDNRNASLDSRFEVGPVNNSQIEGKIMFRIFPFGKVE